VIWIVCAVIAIATLGFTLFVRDKDVPPLIAEDPVRKDLEARKLVVYENMKDLQFEFRQGKLSDADYQSLKSGFQVELAGIMNSIDHLPQAKGAAVKSEKSTDAKSTRTEQQKTQTASKSKPSTIAVVKCASCGTEASSTSKFCGQCGSPLHT
jgi:hypothetical protein